MTSGDKINQARNLVIKLDNNFCFYGFQKPKLKYLTRYFKKPKETNFVSLKGNWKNEKKVQAQTKQNKKN